MISRVLYSLVPTGVCCDSCLRKILPNHTLLKTSNADSHNIEIEDHAGLDPVEDEAIDADEINVNQKRVQSESTLGAANRRDVAEMITFLRHGSFSRNGDMRHG